MSVTTNQIRSIVTCAVGRVPFGYESVVTRVVEAVAVEANARDGQIANALRREARNAGLSSAQVEEVLIRVGLVERPAPVRPAPVQQAAPSTPLGWAGESVEQRLARLEALAQRHGL